MRHWPDKENLQTYNAELSTHLKQLQLWRACNAPMNPRWHRKTSSGTNILPMQTPAKIHCTQKWKSTYEHSYVKHPFYEWLNRLRTLLAGTGLCQQTLIHSAQHPFSLPATFLSFHASISEGATLRQAYQISAMQKQIPSIPTLAQRACWELKWTWEEFPAQTEIWQVGVRFVALVPHCSVKILHIDQHLANKHQNRLSPQHMNTRFLLPNSGSGPSREVNPAQICMPIAHSQRADKKMKQSILQSSAMHSYCGQHANLHDVPTQHWPSS